MEASGEFQSLPKISKGARKRIGRGRRQQTGRKRIGKESLSSATDSPMKLKVTINDSFSSEDEEDLPVLKSRKIDLVDSDDERSGGCNDQHEDGNE